MLSIDILKKQNYQMNRDKSCHTFVYKKISNMSKSEIQKEFDCIINERKNRTVMKLNSKEYAKYLMDAINDSSLSNISYNEAINRYSRAVEENEKMINKLIIGKEKCDISLITEANGFDVINNEYLFLCTDIPFRFTLYNSYSFDNIDNLISFLYKYKNNIIYTDIDNNEIIGISDYLIEKIKMFFNKHGENNLYFEFG